MTPAVGRTKLGWKAGLAVLAIVTGCVQIDESEQAYSEAKAAYAAQAWERALTAFEQFVADYPDSRRVPKVRYYIARCLYKLARFDRAGELFAEVLAAYPTQSFAPKAHYFLARCHYKLQRYAPAVAVFDQFLTAHPESAYTDNAWYYTGRAYHKLAHYAAAVRYLDRVIALGPGDYRERSLFWAGRASYQHGRADPAAITAFPAAERYFEALFAAQAGGAYEEEARYYYAMSSLRQDSFASAIGRYTRFVGAFPRSPYVENAGYYRGYAYYKNLELSVALAEMESFLRDYSASPYRDRATYYAGRCNYKLAPTSLTPDPAYQRAISHFQDVIANYPSSTRRERSYYYLVKSLVHVDDCDAAQARFSEFAATFPASALLPAAQQVLVDGC